MTVVRSHPRAMASSLPSESEHPIAADRAPRTELLYRIASLAARADDPQAALRELLDLLVGAFRADAGSIALLSPETGRLATEVQAGGARTVAPTELPPGHGVTGWCALNRRSLLVPDVAHEPRYIAVRPSARSELAAPIVDGDQVVGVVDLERDETGGFTPADLTLLEELVAEAARVMRRLWELRHLQGKARQLEALLSAGRSLVTKLEEQALFDTLTREAREVLQAGASALYRHDAASGSLSLASFAGAEGASLPTGPLPLDSCAVASAVHTRRQVAFLDIQSPDFRELVDLPADPMLASVLATPLLFEGEVLGVLAVFTQQLHRFDNDEKRLCAALAGLGTVALQNARLYGRVFESEDVLRTNERLTTLGLLAAEIAHEIRNPLTVLKLLHGGLGLDFPAGDPRRTDMRVIGEKLDQLEAIVSRVLNFARAPGSLHARCELADIIEDTLVLVRLKLAQSKVGLSFERPSRAVLVQAHKGQIQQALLNLLLNATHAMPDGGTIAISLRVEPAGGAPHAVVDITDTGCGVPEPLRERIFDSFLSGRQEGTGLGLAIAKRILLSHHGDVTLVRTGPEGTTMRLTLPLA
jgi:signal transduction histidine kinase